MRLWSALKRDFTFYRRLSHIFNRIADIGPKSNNLVCDDLERVCDDYSSNKAISIDGQSLTYAQLDTVANRYAHWAKARGLKGGDTVALILPNRLDYIPIWLGLNKIGVIAALINNTLVGQGLAHCVNVSGASISIVDSTTIEAFCAIQNLITRHQTLWSLDIKREQETASIRSLEAALKGVSSVRPDRKLREDITAHMTALYIYTSGTTGLPKAAKISHSRAQLYMKAFAGLSQMTPKDKMYNVLPLYHSTGGLCGVGAALLNGAELCLKKKFSSSQFWGDINALDITHIVYIGELCRYLMNAPQSLHPEDEKKHKVKMMFGNGMRPEIWENFQKRFGIDDIMEFYGSTEGNVSLFNLDGKPGAIGRIPKLIKSRINMRLVRFDVADEMPERRANGLCIECKPGEIGEAIGQIANDVRHAYSGYADKAATQKKILTDVFVRGDQWFSTGDLMRTDKDGYIYFVDRIGDTFRFKSENVSTSEVSEYCASAPNVDEAIVYGVLADHHDGKAGMAALLVREGFNLEVLLDHLKARLPNYALPRFIRLLTEIETTGTFKYKKMDLVAQGFDVTALNDKVFVLLREENYIPFTKELLSELKDGKLRL